MPSPSLSPEFYPLMRKVFEDSEDYTFWRHVAIFIPLKDWWKNLKSQRPKQQTTFFENSREAHSCQHTAEHQKGTLYVPWTGPPCLGARRGPHDVGRSGWGYIRLQLCPSLQNTQRVTYKQTWACTVTHSWSDWNRQLHPPPCRYSAAIFNMTFPS